MQVPLFRSDLSDDLVREELSDAFQQVLASGNLVLGDKVVAFEEAFAEYLGVDFCVGVANGTDAIELGLRSLGVGPGSKVATVSNAGFYTSTAAIAIGAKPVFMDISLDDGLLTLAEAEAVLVRERPSVIVLTHLYGQMVPDSGVISDLARSLGVKVLEDCAQAHGAILEGRMAGSFGDVSSFSFYPTKNLGGLGDGGAVVTSSPEINQSLRQLRQYGWETKYNVVIAGRNSRLDELQAAFLLARLPKLDLHNKRRVQVAKMYKLGITERPGRMTHVKRDWSGSFVGHLFVMKVKHELRDDLRGYLSEAGVASTIHYPVPDHLQPFMQEWDYPALARTEEWSDTILSLPLFPSMSDEEAEYVIRAVNSWKP